MRTTDKPNLGNSYDGGSKGENSEKKPVKIPGNHLPSVLGSSTNPQGPARFVTNSGLTHSDLKGSSLLFSGIGTKENPVIR